MQLAYQHRGFAFQGLQESIGNFSKGNSDAVLAASILLSWQVTDWLVPSDPSTPLPPARKHNLAFYKSGGKQHL